MAVTLPSPFNGCRSSRREKPRVWAKPATWHVYASLYTHIHTHLSYKQATVVNNDESSLLSLSLSLSERVCLCSLIDLVLLFMGQGEILSCLVLFFFFLVAETIRGQQCWQDTRVTCFHTWESLYVPYLYYNTIYIRRPEQLDWILCLLNKYSNNKHDNSKVSLLETWSCGAGVCVDK